MPLDLSPYKPVINTANDPDALAAGFTAIETYVNGIVTVGLELGYQEFNAPVTVTATTEASANVVVTAPTIAFDGSTKAEIEFFSPSVQPSGLGGSGVVLVLFDGTSLGLLGQVFAPSAGVTADSVFLKRVLTPSAPNHTYSIRAYQSGGNGVVAAGPGGPAASLPGYIRIRKA